VDKTSRPFNVPWWAIAEPVAPRIALPCRSHGSAKLNLDRAQATKVVGNRLAKLGPVNQRIKGFYRTNLFFAACALFQQIQPSRLLRLKFLSFI
jgi:hypothetical protein